MTGKAGAAECAGLASSGGYGYRRSSPGADRDRVALTCRQVAEALSPDRGALAALVVKMAPIVMQEEPAAAKDVQDIAKDVDDLVQIANRIVAKYSAPKMNPSELNLIWLVGSGVVAAIATVFVWQWQRDAGIYKAINETRLASQFGIASRQRIRRRESV
jgi:hypothetical protein